RVAGQARRRRQGRRHAVRTARWRARPRRCRAVHDRRGLLHLVRGAPLMPRRVAILGSTGSIGIQALDVVSRSTYELTVVALSASSAWEPLLEQAQRYGVPRVALADPDSAVRAADAWTDGEVLAGPDG